MKFDLECMTEKSKESYDAALLLLKNGKYNVSAHSSYYSIYQYFICKEPTLSNIDNQGLGSHNKVVNYFKEIVKEKSRCQFAQFSKGINKLKLGRSQADYQSIHIDKSKCISCCEEVKVLKRIIDDIYK